jgi:hypothetical protein
MVFMVCTSAILGIRRMNMLGVVSSRELAVGWRGMAVAMAVMFGNIVGH